MLRTSNSNIVLLAEGDYFVEWKRWHALTVGVSSNISARRHSQSTKRPRSGVKTLFLLFLSCALAHAQTFRFTEPQGPHAVGLRVVEQYDDTRVFRSATDQLGRLTTGEIARPLQTLIWYPALKSASKPMTLADYAEIAYSETTFGKADPSSQWHGWFSTMTPVINDSLWAHHDASALPGRFPVVLYAPSFSALASENLDLCEYLASHGYVVIASPGMGATTRDMTGDLEGIEAQVRDITYLLGFARTLPDTNMEEVAAAGFSWGGISELFAASRDRRIKALVALDGSMRYFPGLVKQAGFVHPEQMAIPMIFFTQGEMSLEDQARYLSDPDKNLGPSVLNAWTHGDLVTVHDLAMTHQEHSALDQRNEDLWKPYANDHKADYTRADGTAGYAWMARYTLNFLDAYLKQDPTAMAFLRRSPRENGAPPHLITTEFRAAKGPPPTLDAFRAEVGRQGFDHATVIYAKMKKSEPDFKLDETTLNAWAMQLLAGDHAAEATAIVKLSLESHPDSANAYTVLGEINLRSGDKAQALDAYQKAIAKDPNNEQAKARLKELGSSE